MALVANPETIRDMLVNDGHRAKQQRVYSVWSWRDAASGENKFEVCYTQLESSRFETAPPAQVMDQMMLYENGRLSVAGKQFLGVPEEAPPSEYQRRLEVILAQLQDPATDPALQRLIRQKYNIETIRQLHEQIKAGLDQVLAYLERQA